MPKKYKFTIELEIFNEDGTTEFYTESTENEILDEAGAEAVSILADLERVAEKRLKEENNILPEDPDDHEALGDMYDDTKEDQEALKKVEESEKLEQNK